MFFRLQQDVHLLIKEENMEENKRRVVKIKRVSKKRDKCKPRRRIFITDLTKDDDDDVEIIEPRSKYEIEYKRRKASQSCEEFIEETKLRLNFLSGKYGKQFRLVSVHYNSDDSGVYEHILTYEIIPRRSLEAAKQKSSTSSMETVNLKTKITELADKVERIENRVYSNEYDISSEIDSLKSRLSDLE